jgi:hypothetical protein
MGHFFTFPVDCKAEKNYCHGDKRELGSEMTELGIFRAASSSMWMRGQRERDSPEAAASDVDTSPQYPPPVQIHGGLQQHLV